MLQLKIFLKSAKICIILNCETHKKLQHVSNLKIERLPGENSLSQFYAKKVFNVYKHVRYTSTKPRTTETEDIIIVERVHKHISSTSFKYFSNRQSINFFQIHLKL